MTYQLRRISDREGYGKTPSVIVLRKQSTIIGRVSSKTPPDCVIESKQNPMMVSRKHAEVLAEEKGNRYFLVDHSLNGTYINYTRILSSKLLIVGDVVCFGHVNGYNIKPGSTVTAFRSELKFVFERVNDSAAAAVAAAAAGSDDASSSLTAGGNRKRRPSSSIDAVSDVGKSRRYVGGDDDVSDSSDSSLSSSSIDAAARRVAAARRPPPSSSSSSAKKGTSGSLNDRKQSKTQPTAAAVAASTSRKSNASGSSRPHSKNSSSGLGGPSSSSSTSASKSASASKSKSASRSSKPSSKSKAAASSDATGQFHIDGEPCASLTCIKPKDPNVNWVCCDSCNSWYHVMCTDLDDDVNLDDIEFFCIKCRD